MGGGVQSRDYPIYMLKKYILINYFKIERSNNLDTPDTVARTYVTDVALKKNVEFVSCFFNCGRGFGREAPPSGRGLLTDGRR